MRWIKLGGKQEPPFEEDILLWNGEYWSAGTCTEKAVRKDKVIFSFWDKDGNDIDGVTHYCIPTPPKD